MAAGGIDGWVSVVGASVDSIANGYASNLVTQLGTALAAPFTAMMTLWWLHLGWQILRGEVNEPVNTILWKTFKTSLIMSLAFSSALYNSNITALYDGMRDDMASVITTASQAGGGLVPGEPIITSSNVWNSLDAFQFAGLQIVQNIDQTSSWYDVGAWLAEALFMGAIVILTIAALYIVILSKIFATFFIGLGPVFILCAIFRPTQRFFDAWIGMMVNTLLLTWIGMFVMGFAIYVANKFSASIFTGISAINPLTTAAEYLAMCCLFALVLWQAPSWASALAGGASMQMGGGMVHSVMSMNRMMQKAPSGVGSGNNIAPASRLGRTSFAVGSAAGMAARGVASVGRVAKYRMAALRGMS